MIATLEVRFFTLKDKICSWELVDSETGSFNSGCARPFKRSSSIDCIPASEFMDLPFTKKQIKTADYVMEYRESIEKLFEEADVIQPYEKYDGALKQTFGPGSRIYELYAQKAQEPKFSANKAELYIDFEAMNMRICGWYALLVDGENTIEFSGIAKPYSDERRLRWLWKNTYEKMLPYKIEDILRARHIHGFRAYFKDMFRRARHIYTYGDTDALFVKYSFGDEIYNFFKVKNVDMSLRTGNRTLSLDKTCKLFGVEIEGDEHDPKNDVLKMKAYMEKIKEL